MSVMLMDRVKICILIKSMSVMLMDRVKICILIKSMSVMLMDRVKIYSVSARFYSTFALKFLIALNTVPRSPGLVTS